MIVIYPSKLNGTLKAAASKAHAQRLLFMSAFAEAPTTVSNIPDCSDIDTTLDALLALGCKVTRKEDAVTVEPFPKNIPVQKADFDFKGSGTTARIAIAMSGALGIITNCGGNPQLQKRRLFSLTSRMAIRGVKFTNFSLPCKTEGRLEGGEYIIEGSEGSQTVSALLMALPILRADSNIKLASPLADSSFVDMTIDALKMFSIKIEKTEDGYMIPGRQQYISPKKISAENDWGLATMWTTAGAACGSDDLLVTVTDLPKNSHQKYKDIQSIITLLHYDFEELNIDARDCPNLATLFAALAIVKGANMEIHGVPQLKFKETDRMKTMAEIAKTLGQRTRMLPDGIEIEGSGSPEYVKGQIIDCKGDPWVFMSMVLASTTAEIPFVISDDNSYEKIYRRFLSDFESLGGQFDIIK